MLLFVGIYTYVINFLSAYPTFEYTLYNLSFIFLIIVPILTMRTIAEDRRNHTMELLYSLPLKLSSVVLGKYFALLTVLAIPCAVFILYPVILSLYGNIEFATAYSTLFSFFLLGAALLALGLFISSLTSNMIVSAVLSFGATLLLYLLPSIAYYLPSSAYGSLICFILLTAVCVAAIYVLTKNFTFAAATGIAAEAVLIAIYFIKPELMEGRFASFLGWFEVFDLMTPFASGLFDVDAVIHLISFAAVFVFLSILALEKRRWS